MIAIQEKAAAVYQVLKEVYGQSPWTLKQILSDMQQEHVDYFTFYHQETLLGFLAIQQLPGEMEITKDRKSTRLNSSHANISYAVFCLKKTKTKHSVRGFYFWSLPALKFTPRAPPPRSVRAMLRGQAVASARTPSNSCPAAISYAVIYL